MLTNFMGTQGFIWFMGVVEDVDDPAQLGRVRVRCFALHSQDKSDLPTEHLPWATVVQPTNSAGTQGIGYSPTGLLVNSQVIGFFADGPTGQFPFVIGVINGINPCR